MRALKKLLAVLIVFLMLVSPVATIGTSMVAKASYASDPLISRVWQYCIDIDKGLVNQINKLDLSNVNDYNKYVTVMNLVNNSKKESTDLLNLAGCYDFSVDNTYVAHSLRMGMENDFVFRSTLGLAGLVFNGNAVKYLTLQNVDKDRYKKSLKSFMKASSADMELLNTTKDVVSILKNLAKVVDNETARSVIHSIMLSVYASKSTEDIRYALKYNALEDYLKGDESAEFQCGSLTKALGLAGDILSISKITINGIYNLASVSSNMKIYETYIDFLDSIENDTSLPLNLRKAASELNADMISQYDQAVKDIVKEVKGFLGGKSLSLAAQEMGSAVIGDVLAAVSIGKLFYNVLIGADQIVEACTTIECYDMLSSKYAKQVLRDKSDFVLNPTLENAEKFRFDYVILQNLRLEGEKKTLEMISFDDLWTSVQRNMMRSILHYKENKGLLKNNIKMIEKAKFMYTDDGATRNLQIRPFYDTTANVQCPVNVRVYDKNNVLVASVIDEKLNEPGEEGSEFPVVIYTDGNDKIIRLISENDYRIEIEAYDSGKMTYTATRYTNSDELASETEYKDIHIEKGDSFVSNPDEVDDKTCRVLYDSSEAELEKLEPTKEYDNKKLPSEDADAAEVIVAEDLFEDLPEEMINKVAEAMFSFSPSVDISSYDVSTGDTVALFSAIAKNYPSEYSLLSRSDFTYRIAYSPSRGCITTIRFYYGENADISAYQRRVDETKAAINALVEKTKGMSDFEKALYVHDYIVLNCEYDHDLLNLINADGTLDGEIYSERYTEYSVLVNGTGICGSYALAYRAVMNACGLDCLFLSSDEMNHGWNLLKLDGKWYHVDCCWDDPTPDQFGSARREYFLRTDDEIMQLNHYSWTPGEYKANSSKYSAMPRYDDRLQKFSDGRWYYLDSGYLYSCDRYGSDREELAAVTANSLDADGGDIYYSYGRGIYELDLKSGNGTLSYCVPDSVSGSSTQYTFIRDLYVEGDDLLCYTGIYRDGTYKFGKYERPACFSSENRAKGLKLSTEAVAMGYGDSKTLTCTLDQKDQVKSVSLDWYSSDQDVVRVDSDGTLRSYNNGRATVYAYWNGLTAECDVTVSYDIGSVDKLKLLKYKISNGEVTITDCDERITGDLEIPSTIEHYPVTGIGDYAFASCRSLTSIIIPDSVTSIGHYTFNFCTSLTSITIPDSVTSIGHDVFWACDSLASIIVDKNNSKYDSRNGCNAIIETETNTLVAGCGTTVIPDSVTGIGDTAFGCYKSLTSITIPDSVTSIGANAFDSCISLTSISIPNSVTSIGSSAFEDCHSLTSITIPDSVTSIGSSAFSDCTSLTSITIPDSVTSIGDRAFSWCYKLTSVTIPNSVTSIGDYAFEGCISLTSITIPNSVTSIGFKAFDCCESLTSITIPDSVTSIESCAFLMCDSLISIIIPDSVTSIGYGAFYECCNLISITIPDSVTSIEDRTFEGCENLTNITISNSVTSIGEYAFSWCDNLTSVIIPDSVTSIGERAFYNSYSLTDIWFTGSEQQWNEISFGEEAIPDGVTVHYNYVPHDHSYTPSVTKPATCTEDGEMTYTCSCGRSYTEVIPATGHKYKVVSSDPGNCFTPAKDIIECEYCHERKEKLISHEGHSYNLVVHEPTCTHSGYTEAYCKACGENVMFDFVAPTGHKLVADRTEATCTKHSSVNYTCSVCGYSETVEDEDSASGCHSYKAVVTPPTCMSVGFTTYTCADCGDSYVADYKDLSGHTEGEWRVTKPATKDSEGERTLYCSVCGKAIRTETVPALSAVVTAVSVDNISMNYKMSARLNPTVTADEGANYTVAYSSSDSSVARVDGEGKVYAAKRGSAKVTCTVTDEYGNTVSDTCTVTVSYAWWQWIIIIVLFGWIWY